MLPIITTPNPLLVTRSSEVEHFDKKLAETIHEMIITLNNTTDPKGVGLAAPQVAIQQRIFITKPTNKSKITVFINPVIKEMSDGKVTQKRKSKLLEGCLSIPTIWGKVTRKRKVLVEYQDSKGKSHLKEFTGFHATVIQHEMDHLDGVLFTKRCMEQGEKLYRTFKNDKGEDEFEELKI